jgi:hypothetical protein
MLKPMVLCAAIGGATFAGYLFSRAVPAKRPAAAAATGSVELDELKGRVAELEQAMAENEKQSLVDRATPGIHLDVPTNQDSPKHEAPMPPQEDLRDLDERRKHRFEELLLSEPRDRSWAPDYETSLRDAVRATAQNDDTPSIDSLTCRTSICRLEITSTSSDAQQRFMGRFHEQLPPMAAVHFTSAVEADGSSKTTLDFVRAGYPTGAIDGPVD